MIAAVKTRNHGLKCQLNVKIFDLYIAMNCLQILVGMLHICLIEREREREREM